MVYELNPVRRDSMTVWEWPQERPTRPDWAGIGGYCLLAVVGVAMAVNPAIFLVVVVLYSVVRFFMPYL